MTEPPTADWRALGTGVRLVVLDGDLDAARRAVEDVLDDVDRAYSRFRDDSEIVALNARAGSPVAVSPLLATAIAAGLRAARITDGAVDPTVGRAMRAIGYDADFDRIRNPAGPIELRIEPIPGWQSVEFSAPRREVRVRRGVELDLGSTGKGLASDLAAAAALAAIAVPGEQARGGVLVSLGGDIAVGGTPPDGGWRILIAEDSETPSDAAGEVVAIETGAMATSSTTVRRWQRGARSLHHLIDPRTGGPVESPWRTASVVAATCVDANTAATAAIVMGDAAIAWLEAARLPARLVGLDGTVTRLGGWPEPDDDPGADHIDAATDESGRRPTA
ncbi:MAG TPA: FAD:protein FMN transferase [Candidatus Limnocylindrales bacterium]|nr:FAD:protein FMN transferase [Candidatus Limnocylindrales bacterium]